MKYRVVKTLTKGKQNIIKDQIIALTGAKHKGMQMRRVEARVEVDGEWRVAGWIPSVADIPQARWELSYGRSNPHDTLGRVTGERFTRAAGHSKRYQLATPCGIQVT